MDEARVNQTIIANINAALRADHIRAAGTLSQRVGESGERLPFPHFARVPVLLFLNQRSPSRITMGVGVGVIWRAPIAAPSRAGGHTLSPYV